MWLIRPVSEICPMVRDTTAATRRPTMIGVMGSCWLDLIEPNPPTRCYPEGLATGGKGYSVTYRVTSHAAFLVSRLQFDGPVVHLN